MSELQAEAEVLLSVLMPEVADSVSCLKSLEDIWLTSTANHTSFTQFD